MDYDRSHWSLSHILSTKADASGKTFAIDFPNPDLPLHVERVPTLEKVGVHGHSNFVEIVLVVSGSARHRWENAVQVLAAGDLFCIAPGEPHGYEDVRNFAIINCLFAPALIRSHHHLLTTSHELIEFLLIEPLYRHETKQRRLVKLQPNPFSHAVGLLENMEEHLPSGPSGALNALGMLYQFLALIAENYRGSAPEEVNQEVIAAQNWAFAQARSQMLKDLSSDLDLKSLADTACLSPAHFSRVFKSATGLSPIAYLTRLRLDRAAELLTSTGSPISAIGMDCGFQDSGYFARVFKKAYGLSPREYRRRAGSS